MGRIHYAKLSESPRLQRLHALLITGKEYSTKEISTLADVMAVSTAVCELREGGFDILCRYRGTNTVTGGKIYTYQMQGC